MHELPLLQGRVTQVGPDPGCYAVWLNTGQYIRVLHTHLKATSALVTTTCTMGPNPQGSQSGNIKCKTTH